MSLVGSLEDLGLGEILQIVSLSGKSGVLWIRSKFGEGHILFDKGAIRGARIEGGPSDLAALIAQSGALAEAEVEALVADARSEGAAFEEMLIARSGLDAGRVDELRERHVEATVLRMFTWPVGEFSFEIREEATGGVEDLLLRQGLNAQFLALEGARLRDENDHEAASEDASPPEARASAEPDASAPVRERDEIDAPSALAPGSEAARVEDLVAPPDGGAELEITVLELLEDGSEDLLPAELEIDETASPLDEDPTLTGTAHAAFATAEPAPEAAAAVSAPAPASEPAAAPAGRPCSGVVMIDRDLAVLEWAKRALGPIGMRAHIFQRSELGIQRIRQYFARGEMPLVVLTTETPADPVSGARDWAEIAARLRAQVPQLRIVVVAAAGTNLVPTSERGVPDAVATRPQPSVLADERAREPREALARELREAVETATRRGSTPRPAAPEPRDAESLRMLREWSARLRDPAPPSEVLRVVLDFAGRHFERAAVLWVREGEAHGMAQRGFAAPGTPEDAAFAALSVGAQDVAAFRKVFEGRAPVRGTPEGPGDAAFLARLRPPAPTSFYVAPIESGEQVAALLYADNAPSGRAIGDTSAVEVIVHEAGLALDRAVLERALEQVEEQRRAADPAS